MQELQSQQSMEATGENHGCSVSSEEAAGYQVHTGFFNSIISMTLPALLKHGTEEQKKNHIPSLISGEVSWCQLFSEPGAGSDLAGLATR